MLSTGGDVISSSPQRLVLQKSAVDEVYHKIKSMILRKELRRGEKLSEVALSRELEVSRTPVREGLRRLAADGFVQIVHNSGAWVSCPSSKEVEDAFYVRAKLEGWAASMASRKVTPLFIARLQDNIEKEEEIFKEYDIEKYLDVNVAFHMIIAEMSGNTVLMDYIREILGVTFVYSLFFERFFDTPLNPSLDEHRRISEAFASQDEDLCVRTLEGHVMESLSSLDFSPCP